MCGVSVIFSTKVGPEEIKGRLTKMEAAQIHRGPDDQGMIVESTGSGFVGIGQQRLSILDLTPAGNQPMISPCNRYVLSFNGEIYNYREIADELGDDPIVAISTGDTAVVLAALARWGASAFKRFNGMWALAFLDRRTGILLLSRDRLGVKPLYYTLADGELIVSSEIKGVLAGAAGRRFRLNLDVVSRFLLQSLNSGQLDTFFEGISTFPAASYAELNLHNQDIDINPRPFWRHPFEREDRESYAPGIDEIRDIFIDSVRLRLRSDVPVGVMLSGGLDSSSILAAATTALPNESIQALSVVTRDLATSEEQFVDLMAAHTGCNLLKMYADDDPQTLWDAIPNTVWALDAPTSSFSTVAHRQIIARARKNGIIVLLSGQGADEQLGGYNKFLYFYTIDRLRRGNVVGPSTMLAGCILNRTILREFTLAHAKRYIPMARTSISRGWAGPALIGAQLLNLGLGKSFEEREWRDLQSLSLPSLLTSEDRMSMSQSCEMRTPFLDYRLVEALGRTSPEAKLKNGWTKHIFRRAMSSLLPSEIAWRKDKKGYSLPGGRWMCYELRPKIEEMLSQPMIAADLGLINQAGARSLFAALVNKQAGVRYQDVLSIVSLEFWLQRFAPYINDQIDV